eukprot:3806881-Prymnesium_polylepis.1
MWPYPIGKGHVPPGVHGARSADVGGEMGRARVERGVGCGPGTGTGMAQRVVVAPWLRGSPHPVHRRIAGSGSAEERQDERRDR